MTISFCWSANTCVIIFLVLLFYGVSTLFGWFNAKLNHFDESFKQFSIVLCLHTVKFQNSSSSNNLVKYNYTVYTHNSIWSIDRVLSSVTSPDQSGTGSDGNEGILNIPQNSSITEALFSVISRTLVGGWNLTSLQRCSRCILQPLLNRPEGVLKRMFEFVLLQ